MAYLTATAMRLARSEDWSGFTVGELYDALLESTGSTLPDACEGTDREMVEYWKDVCKSNVDYLLYLYCDPLGIWPEDKPIAECVQSRRDWELDESSPRTLFALYLNSYFYKYISIEIDRLEHIARLNPSLPYEASVDHFISTLVYEGLSEQYPSRFLGFETLDFVPESRKQSFRGVRHDILRAHETEDKELMFRSVFLLMTYYAGSAYRRVHDAATTILGIDMASFRALFFEHLPSIINNAGGIRINVVARN